MKKICITGAKGFIGKSLCKTLNSPGNYIRGFIRTNDYDNNFPEIEYVSVGDIGIKTNWKDKLKGYDCIIHCAGIAHKMNSNSRLDLYHLANVEGTRNLAEQAADVGIKRLVFLSSIKVNGESTDKINLSKKFSHNDIPKPKDAYAISKLEAERALWEISSRTGLEVVVVRLPLVYGYGVKGNLERLIKVVKSGIPLPLNMIQNKRSMIGIDNLVDLLICCTDHPKANGKTFLASDGEDLSSPELIRLIAKSMGLKAHLFSIPLSLLKLLSLIFGKQKEIDRLIGSLSIDDSYTKEILNWKPPLSIEEGIRRMVTD